jgi:TatD DNase family protein
MYIDLHSHIDMYKEDEIPQIVENAKTAGLKVIVTSGIDPKSNRQILELIKRFPIVKGSMGLYPIDALAVEQGKEPNIDIDAEIEFIKKNKDKICAIGEIGLDYKNGNNKVMQKELFQKLLSLAEQINKPVIIHSRKAEADAIEILESTSNNKIILHCFSGKKNLMLRARDNGWYFTVPTNIVRSDQFQFMAKEVNLSHLFCETDSPFLSPFPEMRNEPAFVVESYKKIAEIKKMDLEEVSKIIYMNWQKVFD